MLWSLVYGLVLTEAVLCLVLVLPMPRALRRMLARAFLWVFSLPLVRTVLYCVAAGLTLLFVDCQRTMYKENHALHDPLTVQGGTGEFTQVHQANAPLVSGRRMLLLRAQRNSYLLGAGLFLLLLLFR
jgi:Bap31/Bap29 transmembrane region